MSLSGFSAHASTASHCSNAANRLRLRILSGALGACLFCAPVWAADIGGTYEAFNVDGYNFFSKTLAIQRLGMQSQVTIRFEQGGGSYPWKGRLVSAEGKAGVYSGRGSGGILWELRDTGRDCQLSGEGLTATMSIFEGTVFDEARGTGAIGYAIGGQTPSGFRFIQMKAGTNPTLSPTCNFLALGRSFERK